MEHLFCLILFCCTVFLASANVKPQFTPEEESQMNLQVIYWEIEPFLINPGNGKPMTGILPLIFRLGSNMCLSKPDMLQFKVNLKTRELHDQVFRNYTHYVYGKGILKNITTPKAVLWGPYNIHLGNAGAEHIIRRGLTIQPLLTSERLVIVQLRDNIAVTNKILRGIANCNRTILLAIMLSFVAGIILWMVEMSYNPMFATKFGPGTGVYWSFVTMVTVGYGDVTATTTGGRILSVIWMFIGLMLAAVMTATLTDTVAGTVGLEVKDKDVAVIKNSLEKDIMKWQYFANTKPYASYDAVIEAVRKREAFAAAIPYEIAVWMSRDILDDDNEAPLSFIYSLPGKVRFDMYYTNDPFNKSNELFKCIFSTFKKTIYETALDYTNRNILFETTVYYELRHVILKNGFFIGLEVVLFALVAIAVLYTVYRFHKEKVKHLKTDKFEEAKENEREIDEQIKKLQHLLEIHYKEKSGKEKVEIGTYNKGTVPYF